MNGEYAYVTALTTESYIPGCMALVRSLIEVKSQYRLIILLPEPNYKVLLDKLNEYGIFKVSGDYVKVVTKPDLSVPDYRTINAEVDMKYSFWEYSFFKLQAMSLFDYSKVILLDCDQMAVKNIDHLFLKPHMTATTCGRCIHPDWVSISSGLLVIEPTQNNYNDLIKNVEPAVKKKYLNGMQAGDQDVFNEYCPNWHNNKDLYIPEKYNICWGMIEILCRKESISVNDFYMIHFPGKEKPWNKPGIYYLWILFRYIFLGKTDRLLYKVKVYRKYRKMCNSK